MSSDNAQKTYLADSIQRFTESKTEDARQLEGKRLPVSVAEVRDWTVVVKFEVSSSPYVFQNLEVPFTASRYERPPLQVGDLGWLQVADARIGGVTGLGSGVASLARPGNLAATVFEPISNANWDAPPDRDAYLVQGPNGFVFRKTTGDCSVVGDASGVTVSFGGRKITTTATTITMEYDAANSITVSSSGVEVKGTLTINGVPYLGHEHTGVQSGGSNTGPVA